MKNVAAIVTEGIALVSYTIETSSGVKRASKEVLASDLEDTLDNIDRIDGYNVDVVWAAWRAG